jgi:hypothetical protein
MRRRICLSVLGLSSMIAGAVLLGEHYTWCRRFVSPNTEGWAWWSEILSLMFNLAFWPWITLATLLFLCGFGFFAYMFGTMAVELVRWGIRRCT